MGAVLAGGEGALLSHRSAASFWGLAGHRLPVDVTVPCRRRRPGIEFHECGIHLDERTVVDEIPVTTPARTLLDHAEMVDEDALARSFEEADRQGLLDIPALELVCVRGFGRHGVKPLRKLLDAVREPATRSPLEARVLALCRAYSLPLPETNVEVLGREVDAVWPDQRLMVEADGYAFHGHRAAFERDRARDAEMQVAGYRVIRLTHRRLEEEPDKVAEELRSLLNVPPLRGQKGPPRSGTSSRGQGTVEWVGLLAVVALLLVALLAAGVRVPGVELARAVAAQILCAAALRERCGDEPVLVAAYGSEVGELVREHMPSLLYERGSRALPVDFRRCRSNACGDGPRRGLVTRSDAGLPVTAFVHVIDCRSEAAARSEETGYDCSGERAGNLYLQYWTYYVDSATLRGVPVAGRRGYHRDDWEGVQIRIGPDGRASQRASSHNGFNHRPGVASWGADLGSEPLRGTAEALGLRPRNGWGPQTGLLLVAGGSHAGSAAGIPRLERITLGRDVRLVPLEPIAATDRTHFAVTPPWRKLAWRDPEAESTS